MGRDKREAGSRTGGCTLVEGRGVRGLWLCLVGEHAGRRVWADSVPLHCCPSTPEPTPTNTASRCCQLALTTTSHHPQPTPSPAMANAAATLPSHLAAHLPTAASKVGLGHRHPRLPPLRTPRPTMECSPSTLPPTADPAPHRPPLPLPPLTAHLQTAGWTPPPAADPAAEAPEPTAPAADSFPARSLSEPTPPAPRGWLLTVGCRCEDRPARGGRRVPGEVGACSWLEEAAVGELRLVAQGFGGQRRHQREEALEAAGQQPAGTV